MAELCPAIRAQCAKYGVPFAIHQDEDLPAVLQQSRAGIACRHSSENDESHSDTELEPPPTSGRSKLSTLMSNLTRRLGVGDKKGEQQRSEDVHDLSLIHI
eukprot:TRINITY_DN34692_c0_g1_i1.p2 TRINITY_DN34692_c0_g1~~TRINITY_DN34692_c0_g1_i1.p2  ORF type:complete len:101 (+),score=25.11 TRINITY_DN34692_c0_g1_i1:179-481(+)